MVTDNAIKHPAKFSPQILREIGHRLDQEIRDKFDGQISLMVLDPFGGTGLIHTIAQYGIVTLSIELEQEWAVLADACAFSAPVRGMSYHGDMFFVTETWTTCPTMDVVVTSPAYGNRMADHHEAKDDSMRNTYRHKLGRPLSPNNSGAMQWGDEYRDFHRKAWQRVYDLLVPGGLFLLNVKDHIRKHRAQGVPQWHAAACLDVGFVGPLPSTRFIESRGNRQGENGNARVAGEFLYVFRKRNQDDPWPELP